MEINFSFTSDINEKKVIDQGLTLYNTSVIGRKPIISYYLLLKENGIITGGLFFLSVWDWLMIENYYCVQPEETMKLLLKYAENFAVENNLHSIGVRAIEDKYKKLLQCYGFNMTGQLEERPPGYDCCYMSLSNIKASANQLDKKYDVICIDKENEDTDNFNQMIKKYYSRMIEDISNPEFCIKAVIDNEIVGGIIYNLGWGWLYIDTLWIDEKHRGKYIGKKLLQMAEENAMEMGFCRAYLGTTEFQARVFYEKNGYSVFSINDNLPNGYKNYSMKKTLKK